MTNTFDSTERDPEQAAAAALLRACGDLLAAQASSQADRVGQLAAATRAATELRFEVTMMTGEPRSAAVRIVALDGEGTEVALLRALAMTPPPRGALQ
jgi:hypothetical protein